MSHDCTAVCYSAGEGEWGRSEADQVGGGASAEGEERVQGEVPLTPGADQVINYSTHYTHMYMHEKAAGVAENTCRYSFNVQCIHVLYMYIQCTCLLDCLCLRL